MSKRLFLDKENLSQKRPRLSNAYLICSYVSKL
nr:MAG TPA: hypothetical protein [Caudoviricetes sp.]DAT62545.1 MAG TPA: hypothetical protein [Caudoviricetes sp.]